MVTSIAIKLALLLQIASHFVSNSASGLTKAASRKLNKFFPWISELVNCLLKNLVGLSLYIAGGRRDISC